MPIEIIIDKTHRLVTTRCWGRVTDGELAAAKQVYDTNPELDSTFARLWDLSQLKTVEVSEQGLAALLLEPVTDHVQSRSE